MEIIKRDGRKVQFDKKKIERAILAAFKQVDGEISEYAEKKAENDFRRFARLYGFAACVQSPRSARSCCGVAAVGTG